MRIKTISRRVPGSRENTRDNFRVNFKTRTDFDVLNVTVTSTTDARLQQFYFNSQDLPDRDSIHFTTSLENGKLKVKWRGVQPTLISSPIVIQLQPEWFQTGYYVYVVHVIHKKSNYFYIGMTGDRKYKTARSPFYRMSGHFNKQPKSTENHIIKGLRKKLGMTDSQIDQTLCDAIITYYSYLVQPVCDQMDRHDEKRKFAESVESVVIKLMKKQYGEQVIFNERNSSRDLLSGEQVGCQLFGDLQKRIQHSDKKPKN